MAFPSLSAILKDLALSSFIPQAVGSLQRGSTEGDLVMDDSRKTLVIVLSAAAALLVLFVVWRSFSGSAPSNQERMNTKSGPISPMSSMFGPDASGKPRTQRPG